MGRRQESGSPGELNVVLDGFGSSLRKNPSVSVEELFDRVDGSGRIAKVSRSLPDIEKQSLVDSVIGNLRPGRYVEVGVGTPRIMGRTYTDSSPYLGIDGRFSSDDIGGQGSVGIRDQDEAVHVEGHLRSINDNNPHIGVIHGDGRHLHLPDGSAQEVFMGSVIIAPGIRPDTTLQLLTEAKRVLAPETGTLVIGEHDVMLPETLRERLGILRILLDRVGFRGALFTDRRVEEALNWPIDPLDRIGAQFVIAKPTATNL